VPVTLFARGEAVLLGQVAEARVARRRPWRAAQ
jgi:hypothetical protein